MVLALRKFAGAVNLYIALVVNWQPAPAGCGGVAHRMLAGMDELDTGLASIWQSALACCRGVVLRKLAGMDDLYTAHCTDRKLVACSDLLRGIGAQEACWC